MILPSNAYATIPVVEVQPSYTYRVETSANRIVGYTDNLAAMVQAYDKILKTERYSYPIYNTNYGIELQDLIGKDMDLVLAVLPDRIKDAFSADDRTIEVTECICTKLDLETIQVDVTVMTTEGQVQLREVINTNGTR